MASVAFLFFSRLGKRGLEDLISQEIVGHIPEPNLLFWEGNMQKIVCFTDEYDTQEIKNAKVA